MILVRSDDEGMDLVRLGMGEERQIDLVKSTIG